MKKITTYLIAIAAIMLLSFGANAQGGLAPLMGSTHNYTVVAADDINNTLAWAITSGPVGGYTVNSGASGEVVNITWKTAGTYTLQFTETDATTNCATVKTVSVIVSNAFDVSTSSPTAICNAADGQINYVGSSATTPITFKVDMVTGVSTFNPNWEITFTLTPAGAATLANVKAGTTSLTPLAGVYTATGLTSSTGAGTVNITMDVTGDQYSVQTVALTITSAKELTNNNSDKDSDDWTATQTINDIPNTSTITTD